jgi:chromosome segregation ATPase
VEPQRSDEIERLTASYLALEDRCALLHSQLLDERDRRLHDLDDIAALHHAVATSQAAAAELRDRLGTCERDVVELTVQLGAARDEVARLVEARAAETWSPHMLRLRSLWRRLPDWVRGPSHRLLAVGGRTVDRLR